MIITKRGLFTIITSACSHREFDETDTEEYFCTNTHLEDYGDNPETPGEPWQPCNIDNCPVLKEFIKERCYRA